MSLHMELAAAAYKLAFEVMRVREGESVLIFADTASDEDVVKATANACTILGAKPSVMWFKMNPYIAMNPPKPAIAAMNNTQMF